MKSKFNFLLSLAVAAFVVASCSKESDPVDVPTDTSFNPTKDSYFMEKREIRAGWIATVSNLDWPLTKGNAESQKQELISILDNMKAMNFNAVILQVRPMADALYSSSLEPWSSVLTGEQGKNPGYDPLEFAVQEAHKRGMQLHAWLNPYRIGPTSLALAPNHVAVSNPSWVVTFNGTRYFNPGIPAVRAHLVAVVKDIINRYDVDAIHFDDYFYPSGAKSTTPFVFDDQAAYNTYASGLDVDTWRANNVSTMVKDIYDAIKATKPDVAFGISPAGVRENSLALYADPLEWLTKKWVDYLAPQVYWQFGHATADFGKQATYWSANANGIPMMIGIAAYKYKDAAYPAFADVSEYSRQVEAVRATANLSGCMFFRAAHLQIADISNLLKGLYTYKSLVPILGAHNAAVPATPALAISGAKLSWGSTGAASYVVYAIEKDAAKNSYMAKAVYIGNQTEYTGQSGKYYFVTAANKYNMESNKSNLVKVQ